MKIAIIKDAYISPTSERPENKKWNIKIKIKNWNLDFDMRKRKEDRWEIGQKWEEKRRRKIIEKEKHVWIQDSIVPHATI